MYIRERLEVRDKGIAVNKWKDIRLGPTVDNYISFILKRGGLSAKLIIFLNGHSRSFLTAYY